MSDMVETMAFHGATPWHEKGTPIPAGMTAADALVAAGLDWETVLRSAWTTVGGLMAPVPNAQAVVRVNPDGTDRDTIAIVGNKYTCIQNSKLAEWADALSKASEGRAYVECAGSLDEGRRVWMLMRHNGDTDIKIAGDDSPIQKYMLLASSHDGTMNTLILCTGVRVVCHNTMQQALRAAGLGANGKGKGNTPTIKVRHTSGSEDKLDAAIAAVGDVDSYFEALSKIADGLSRTPFSRDKYNALVNGLLKIKDEDTKHDTVPARTAKERDRLIDLLDTTPGAQPGNAWGAYNAIVDYADHWAPTRGGDAIESRCQRQLSGVAVEMKQTALDLIIDSTREQWGTLALRQIAADTSAKSTGRSILEDMLSGN